MGYPTSLPESVSIVEIVPRDGFQNTKEFIPTERKIDIIERLLRAGIQQMQISSFVSPKAIPQMQDAEDVVASILSRHAPVGLSALVPNERGARRAADAGVTDVTYVISVTESHNRANVNRPVEDSFEELARILHDPRYSFREVKLDLATAFGCPFEGVTPLELVEERVSAAYQIGIRTICVCDTIGTATPRQTGELISTLFQHFPDMSFRVHFHDTRGAGIANNLAAIEAGVTIVETSAAGIGGCPFAPGAAGNTATEDLVFLLNAMGVDTGIDLSRLVAAAKDIVGTADTANVSSHLVQVGDDKLFVPGLYKV
jgi:hydroxymethylglutaryl-CoA lyase